MKNVNPLQDALHGDSATLLRILSINEILPPRYIYISIRKCNFVCKSEDKQLYQLSNCCPFFFFFCRFTCIVPAFFCVYAGIAGLLFLSKREPVNGRTFEKSGSFSRGNIL